MQFPEEMYRVLLCDVLVLNRERIKPSPQGQWRPNGGSHVVCVLSFVDLLLHAYCVAIAIFFSVLNNLGSFLLQNGFQFQGKVFKFSTGILEFNSCNFYSL